MWKLADPSELSYYILIIAEVVFCFINDSPLVDGANLTAQFDLRGCANVMCQTTTTDLVDCTPELGSTMGEYSVSNLPQRNTNGHVLTVTVMPSSPDSQTQVFTRAFRTGKVMLPASCTIAFVGRQASSFNNYAYEFMEIAQARV